MIFLSVIAVMQVIFWTEDICVFISYCWNSFSCKLNKLINKQVIFYSPSNALYSSEECLLSKISKHRSFVLSLVCVPFSIGPICNSLPRKHSFGKTTGGRSNWQPNLFRIKKIKQMGVIVKTKCFYSFTVKTKSR